MLPDNFANLLIVCEACADLLTRHTLTWNQALECSMPDHTAARIINLKDDISTDESENIKFQTALTFCARQEYNVDEPLRSQLLCVHEMKRFYLQCNDQLESQKFF